MSIHIRYELQLLFLSFLTGAWLMMSYDIFRIFRIFVRHGAIWTGLEDIIYWTYASLVTFSLLYRQNDGGLRGYAITGVFAGMLLYDRLFSRILLKLLKKAIKYFKMKISRKQKKAGD